MQTGWPNGKLKRRGRRCVTLEPALEGILGAGDAKAVEEALNGS